jgi:D-serine deaminase-like pyridoxal phosphate-dependent protein
MTTPKHAQKIVRLCGGNPDKWRPHVKTTKIREVYAELARAGVRCFKAATPREADVLASVLEAEGVSAGADILVAFPLVGPGLARLARVASRFPLTSFSVLVETVDAASELPPNLSFFIDVNPGMHRTGMPLSDAEGGLAASVAAAGAPGRFRGVHFYDGHATAIGVPLDARREGLSLLYDRLLALDKQLAAAGFPVGELITAGTPAFTSSLSHRGLASTGRHRVSPGTVVFHDLQYELLNPDLHLEPGKF